MKTKKEMKKEILSWISGVPNLTFRCEYINKVGRDYVYSVSLYEGSKPEKTEIEVFYEMNKNYIERGIYQ